jgi:hypothetical protein
VIAYAYLQRLSRKIFTEKISPTAHPHLAEVNAIFDREQVDGLIKRDVLTTVHWEKAKVLSQI